MEEDSYRPGDHGIQGSDAPDPGWTEPLLSAADLESIRTSFDSPLLLTDSGCRLRYANTPARRLLDLTPADIGLPLAIRTRPALTRKIHKRAGNGPAEFRTSLQRRHFQVRISPTAAAGSVIVFHDNTEAERLHEKVRRAGARQRTLAGLHQATMNALSAQFAVVNPDGVILELNEAWHRGAESGAHPFGSCGIGANYLSHCEQDARRGSASARTAAAALRAVLGGSAPSSSFDYQWNAESGTRFFRCLVTPVQDPDVGGAIVLHIDVSDDVVKDAKIVRQLAALDSVHDPVLITDSDGRIEWSNPAFHRLSVPPSSDPFTTPEPVEHPAGRTAFQHSLAVCRASRAPYTAEISFTTAAGRPCIAIQTITPIFGAGASITHFVVTLEDITGRRRVEEKLRYIAEHDELTGLLNRRTFVARLSDAIASRPARRFAVFLLDLDRFKDTNDMVGHLVGDQIIREIGARLRSVLHEFDTLARFGGDQFAFFAGVATDPAPDIAMLIGRLQERFARPIGVTGRPLVITASIGVAVYPDDGQTPEELIRNSDLAMYRAKADGRRAYRRFDRFIDSDFHERAYIERRLSNAIAAQELWIAFQPQKCLRSGTLIGAESLLRWKSFPGREVPISKVISVAEQSGLILNIGEWVINQSLEQVKLWREAGHSLGVSVNLSAVQFNQQDVFGLVVGMLAEMHLPPSVLKAEITESVLLDRSAHVRDTLNDLHSAGVGLVLDDFGTGYSSLTYLQRFPIEAVKIDSSFLQGIGTNSNDEAIVKGVILLAHSLGQRVIAEGVETQLQLDFLRACECDHAQGFLFSEPLPATDFDRLLTQTPNGIRPN